ncbi:YodD family protein [Klebsiella variicola subsp. variicola]|nr:cytoplasmic protein [Klebsiella variicola]PIA09652.1 cytoplasmic protein [Klebsiella variicola]VTN73213.1 cytoplasmic protein [Klebsiella variicola]
MMKNRLTGQAGNDVDVNVDALLAAINEISESEIHRTLDDPQRASIDGRGSHTWRELAEAFELDIRDFSASEVNR